MTAQTPAAGQASMDITSVSIERPRSEIIHALREAWSAAAHEGSGPLADDEFAPSLSLPRYRDDDQCFVRVEWWQVRDAHFRLGSMSQREVYQTLGALYGAWSAVLSPALLWAGPRAALRRGAEQGTRRAMRVHDSLARTLGNYDEVTVLVPGVVVAPGRVRVTYVAAMYADSAYARGMDTAVAFGLNKRSGVMRHDEHAQQLHDVRGQTLLHAAYRDLLDRGAEPDPPSDETVLGQLSGGVGVLSRLELLRPAPTWSRRCTLQVCTDLCTVLRAGSYGDERCRVSARRYLRVPTQLHIPHGHVDPRVARATTGSLVAR